MSSRVWGPLVGPFADSIRLSRGRIKNRVRDRYDAIATRYEKRWSRYVRASTRETLRRLTVRSRDRVLDVGCGTGALLARLSTARPEARLMGVDLSLVMLAQARRRLPSCVLLVAADAEALPFASGSFDSVVSSSSFHYWPAPADGLRELHRVMRPGGRVVITDWCDDYLACHLCDRILRWIDPTHYRIYGGEECRALLTSADYEVLGLERYRISWIWGLMTATARTPVTR